MPQTDIWSGEKKSLEYLEELGLVSSVSSQGSVGFCVSRAILCFLKVHTQIFKVDFWPSGVDGIRISQKLGSQPTA